MKTESVLSLVILITVLFCSSAQAVKYPDWVFQDFTSAYTLHKNDVEATGSWLAMNDMLDLFDVRKEQIGSSALLTTSIGDYSGGRFLLQYGLTDRLMLNGMFQQAQLDTTLGSSSTFKDIASTDTLDTSTYKVGARFKLMLEKRRLPAVSLEMEYRSNDSDDAGFGFSELNSSSVTIPKGSHSLMLSDLHDQGYRLNLIASKNLKPYVHTLFAGIGQYDSDSRLTLLLDSPGLKLESKQDFTIDETTFFLGYTLGIQWFDRMPMFLSYTYINSDADMNSSSQALSNFIPAKYSDTASMNHFSENHILSGKLVYWITPHINLTLDGTLYKNHFLGIVPHYNNSFTNRFFDYNYGYVGVGIGIAF